MRVFFLIAAFVAACALSFLLPDSVRAQPTATAPAGVATIELELDGGCGGTFSGTSCERVTVVAALEVALDAAGLDASVVANPNDTHTISWNGTNALCSADLLSFTETQGSCCFTGMYVVRDGLDYVVISGGD